jgi:hypothetical protein
MKLWGYTRRADGTYAKTVEFVEQRGGMLDTKCVETLVRSRSGRLLRVERTKRALSLARRHRDA